MGVSRIWEPFRRFWVTDRGLSILLLLLVVLIFIVPVSGLTRTFSRLVIDALFTLLMVAGVVSVSRQRGAVIAVFCVAVAGLAVRWLGRLAPSDGMEIAIALSGVASVATLAYVVLTQVFRAGPVTSHRIMGAIAVYLLLGLAWGQTYFALALGSPGAFSLAHTISSTPHEWMYFSFVTLTTVGYGDITPVSSVARTLAVMEALTGQLYPAILLARLVALEVSAPRES
jgi:voltage-gated potassium channel Kch